LILESRFFFDQTGQVEVLLDPSGIFSSLNHPPSTLDLSAQPGAALTPKESKTLLKDLLGMPIRFLSHTHILDHKREFTGPEPANSL
jgi:hypothetical protein